ncbi:unnamed protein product [Didymodactylos carnosus]|uniref:Non-specific protein-tyrosine kinase n=1 Tax=Didymodactylos carnosus TaxID=1234261 RepID=A0A815YDH8_9BILA|nr:unnamed protein product [Didymodactylos carnosus]CAF4432353.1 unnamed protein product [Didymodactylos carnosus]
MSGTESLICPITFELFRDPVVAEDGHTYEKQAIIDWIKRNQTSPITRQPLCIETLRPNYIVKKLVDEFETNVRAKNYQFKLGTDVKKAKRALFQTYGKSVFEAEWLGINSNETKRPKIILLKIDGARAKKEASFCVELSRHPHIVRTYGLVEDTQQNISDDEPINSIMLLQEHATEGNLVDFLQALDSLPASSVLLEMFVQISDAMSFLAHNHIVHGDLACRNVLVFHFDDNEPKKNLVKLTDFGLSRASTIYQSVQSVKTTTMTIVPIRYAAPELLSVNNYSDSYTEKSDMYSMFLCGKLIRKVQFPGQK